MDIKRYDVGGYYGHDYCDDISHGDWVLFDDHSIVVASLQSELTKARELFREVWEFSDRLPDDLRDRIHAFLAQSTPAAKDGESGEPLCLLCLDKKTVLGPKHGDFVRDCPECCGEEG